MWPVAHGIPVPPAGSCFFLDFDGTLVDFGSSPDTIIVPDELSALLQTLREKFDGAVAIVTGRALPDIDRHLAPLCLPTAALHGAIRRDAAGRLCGHLDVDQFISRTTQVRARLRSWLDEHPGLFLEDKGMALALHFRAMPVIYKEQRSLQQVMHRELTNLLPEAMEVLAGDLVLEIRNCGTHKGSAVEAFLAETPFAGRLPVYLGDDLADARAMAAVEKHGGLAVAVGHRVPAQWRLASPAAARSWLRGCVQQGSCP